MVVLPVCSALIGSLHKYSAMARMIKKHAQPDLTLRASDSISYSAGAIALH
jgi:hypothetical protein